jgi:hypothetical protein
MSPNITRKFPFATSIPNNTTFWKLLHTNFRSRQLRKCSVLWNIGDRFLWMSDSGFHRLVFHFRNRPLTKLDLFVTAGRIISRHVLTWPWQLYLFLIARILGHLELENGSWVRLPRIVAFPSETGLNNFLSFLQNTRKWRSPATKKILNFHAENFCSLTYVMLCCVTLCYYSSQQVF